MRFRCAEIDNYLETAPRTSQFGKPTLRGRILQNLGILENTEGNYSAAAAHYQNSLQAFVQAGDERGCAVSYHNLGMVSMDLWWHPGVFEAFKASLVA